MLYLLLGLLGSNDSRAQDFQHPFPAIFPETISRCLFLAVGFIQTRGNLIEDPIGKQSTDVNGAYARLNLLVFPKTHHHETNCVSLSDKFIT